MDGYAVRAADVATASGAAPGRLRLAGRAPVGKESRAMPVASGACARVSTGSPLPPGADAVVMQEDARLIKQVITDIGG
jgi:molybdopterin molybdotransferase